MMMILVLMNDHKDVDEEDSHKKSFGGLDFHCSCSVVSIGAGTNHCSKISLELPSSAAPIDKECNNDVLQCKTSLTAQCNR